MARIPKYIADLIAGGESITLDFKFEISDSRKIAKTLVAFANTQGGKLLIGVKDNGKIAGVRTNEELFMIESAANLYSRPKIKYTVKPWSIGDKTIVELTVLQGNKKPYYAKDYDNSWKAYVRVADQNILADRVLIGVWKYRKKRTVKISYSRKEQFLIDYLNENDGITFDEFVELAEISAAEAEKILIDFVMLDIITVEISEKKTVYKIKPAENK